MRLTGLRAVFGLVAVAAVAWLSLPLLKPKSEELYVKTASLQTVHHRALESPATKLIEVQPPAITNIDRRKVGPSDKLDQALTSMRRLLTSEQPYPELVSLHQRGGPGDYALVKEFLFECRGAWTAVHMAKEKGLLQGVPVPFIGDPRRPNNLTGNEISARHAQRIDALQRIESRCSQVLADTRLQEPHPSDEMGKRLEQLGAEMGSDPQSTRRYVEELQRQGFLLDGMVIDYLMRKNASEFQGLESSWQYQGLLVLFAHSLYVDPSRPTADLRSLATCISTGDCEGKIEDVSLDYFHIPKGSKAHQRALELLPKMRAMLER